MPDAEKETFFGAINCKVVEKSTETDYVVETEDGAKISISTHLPDIRVGHKGIVLVIGEKSMFVREPYGGDMR
jgi:hypothetical protein